MRRIKRRTGSMAGLALAGVLLASCGIPGAALDQARVQTLALATLPETDAGVRQALVDQARQWQTFAALTDRRDLGGIWPVSADFPLLAHYTADIAQREADLIAQSQDDAALNREMLKEFAARWQQARKYLEQ